MLSRVSRDEMHLSPVDLSAIATAIADELRRNHPDRRIEFVIAPNLRAQGDARLLRIALENLLGNACKFSGGQPLARIEFGSGSDARGTVFHIRDNGAGFDMTHAHKLFGAFQRFHTAAEFPGTGIGLATVQRIIHRHGGRIWAESQPGHGATFFFILPEHTSTTP
jgi:signal transduction histidine kinase